MREIKIGPLRIILTITKSDCLLLALFLAGLLFILIMSGAFDFSHGGSMRDRIRIGELNSLQERLGLYYQTNGYFPKSLVELSEFPKTGPLAAEEYLYAIYPLEKPNTYHLGVILETAREELKQDSDFNSEAAGYVNGFNGKDPTLDFHLIKLNNPIKPRF